MYDQYCFMLVRLGLLESKLRADSKASKEGVYAEL